MLVLSYIKFLFKANENLFKRFLFKRFWQTMYGAMCALKIVICAVS